MLVLQCILPFQNCSAILDPVHFHINLRTGLSISTKNKQITNAWDFD